MGAAGGGRGGKSIRVYRGPGSWVVVRAHFHIPVKAAVSQNSRGHLYRDHIVTGTLCGVTLKLRALCGLWWAEAGKLVALQAWRHGFPPKWAKLGLYI